MVVIIISAVTVVLVTREYGVRVGVINVVDIIINAVIVVLVTQNMV